MKKVTSKQTCFQTPDGHFFGWEGVRDEVGSCAGSCTHVWNYEQTTPLLFSYLSRSLREVEFLHSTNDEGAMRFRTKLPLSENTFDNKFQCAADGQMGCISICSSQSRASDNFLKVYISNRDQPFSYRDSVATDVPAGLAISSSDNPKSARRLRICPEMVNSFSHFIIIDDNIFY